MIVLTKQWVFQRKLSFNATTLDKNCGKTKNFPFPQLSMLFLGMRWKVPEDNNIETGGRVFSEVGCVMQKNNVFAKIFCSGLSENFRDLVIILSKIVTKCYQSFISPFEHKESHILKQTEFNYMAVMGKGTDQCLPFDSTKLKSSQLSSRDFWSQASVRKS